MPDTCGASPILSVGVVPVADFSRSFAIALTTALSRHLTVPCRTLEALPRFEIPLLAGRHQFDADALLHRVARQSRGEGEVVLALTSLDLGIEIFTFVFGRAIQGGRAAVVSTARLDPEVYGLPADRALLTRRAVAEMLHELGHLAGLGHCDDFGCIMRFAGNVERIDLRGVSFCSACRPLLPPGLVHVSSADADRPL